MKKIITYTIPLKTKPLSIDEFLRAEGYSRRLITSLKNIEMSICVNGEPAHTNYRLAAGQELMIHLAEEESSPNIVPVPMELDIIYEDDDLLVINKAAHTPIHPSQGNYDCTLANGMADYFKRKGESFVYRAVNRLDRDTTGLLILAKHQLSASILSHMVKERLIRRRYLAVVLGQTDEDGTVTAPIGRAEGSTIQRCIDFEQGEYACTHHKRIFYNEAIDCSLLALTLETGRTHQIRVHMNYIGHPLPGDFLYHPDYRYIGRQALHSHQLEFLHPLTKKELRFEVPLPADMRFIYDTGLRSPLG